MLIVEWVTTVNTEIKAKQEINIKQAVDKMREAFDTPGTRAIRGLLGKMGVLHKLWGLETDYQSTVLLTGRGTVAKVKEVEAGLEGMSVSCSASNAGVVARVSCNHLINVGEVLVRMADSYSVDIQPARDSIVTTASDKLCAEERVFAKNAMSKQD